MRHPAINSARADNTESRPDARADIVLAISEALADPRNALAGFSSVLDRSGYSEEEILSAFESVDDLKAGKVRRWTFALPDSVSSFAGSDYPHCSFKRQAHFSSALRTLPN